MASPSIRHLSLELKALQREPVEGFKVFLPNESNLYIWHVAIFGPPDTLYQGGYFKAEMKFPEDYPYSPPKFRFLTNITHPNVYPDGELCISILHPPGEDPVSGELPSERWNPTQSVRTILLSVISLLNEPNTFSAANVDASVKYRRWRESRGKDKEYEVVIRREIEESRREAEKDGIKVPSTLEEYCQQYRPVVPSDSHSDFDLFDDYDENDDYICSDEEDDVMEDGEEEEDNEDVDDSGCNGNS